MKLNSVATVILVAKASASKPHKRLMQHSLKDVGIKFVRVGEELDDDEKAAEWEGYQ